MNQPPNSSSNKIACIISGFFFALTSVSILGFLIDSLLRHLA